MLRSGGRCKNTQTNPPVYDDRFVFIRNFLDLDCDVFGAWDAAQDGENAKKLRTKITSLKSNF